jgi:hypothetical protein
MTTVGSYGAVKYHVSSSGVLCSHSQLPAGTAISGSIFDRGPAAAVVGDSVTGAVDAAEDSELELVDEEF